MRTNYPLMITMVLIRSTTMEAVTNPTAAFGLTQRIAYVNLLAAHF